MKFEKIIKDEKFGEEWGYFSAKAIGKKAKINLTTKEIIIEEKYYDPENKLTSADKWVRYSPEESQILADTIGKITPEIHRIKRIFQGTIINLDGTIEKE